MIKRTRWLLICSALAAAMLASTVPGQACELEKGVYRLIEDRDFELVLTPPDPNAGAEIARVQLRHEGKPFLSGYLTAAMGSGAVYFVPKPAALEESNINVLFLDRQLRVLEEDADFLVIPELAAALRVHTRDLAEQHPIPGAVWRRERC